MYNHHQNFNFVGVGGGGTLNYQEICDRWMPLQLRDYDSQGFIYYNKLCMHVQLLTRRCFWFFFHIFTLTYLNPKTLTGIKMKEIHLYYALLMFYNEL